MTTKKPTPSQLDASEPTVDASNGAPTNWSIGTIFWGLLLVLVGTLLLLANFGVVSINPLVLLDLWPIAIIALGVSFLKFSGTWWKLLSVLLIVVCLGFVAWALVDDTLIDSVNRTSSSFNKQSTEVKYGNDIKKLNLSVTSGATNLQIDSLNDRSKLVTALLKDDRQTLQSIPTQEGSTQTVQLRVESDRRIWLGPGANDALGVQISKLLPVELKLTNGASRITADLTEVNVTDLVLDTGASRADITLGATNDLTNVNIDAGASTITIRVPNNSGITVQLNSGLTANNFDTAIKKITDDLYRTDNYDTASKKISITAKTGATRLTVVRY